ncbi:MAG: ABC transporter permease, partial [Nitrospirae bacterium]|nr:ABC transporter permease [Nitrospirota bacterium]
MSENFKKIFLLLGAHGTQFLRYTGGVSILALQTFYYTFSRPFNIKAIILQMDFIGVKSISIVGLTALSSGMVMALQTAYGLGRFGAKSYVG